MFTYVHIYSTDIPPSSSSMSLKLTLSFVLFDQKRLLPPSSCLNTEIKLLALARGYLNIEAVRVTDVASDNYINIRDLPDIVVIG